MNDTTPQTPPKSKWGPEEKAAWLSQQEIKRSYFDDVVVRVNALTKNFRVECYSNLSYGTKKHPLYIVKTIDWATHKDTILVTGGVHGYETSGVHGALHFLESIALSYSSKFNIVVVPCVSPWGYETINRWNPLAIDPNRSFYADSPSEESAALMKAIEALGTDLTMHIDLHETTDTDNTEFRPLLASRDGEAHINWNIPDGFYLVGDVENPVPQFQSAIIKSVKKITHIAPPDDTGNIIGEPLLQEGVINYAARSLGLCIGFTHSQFSTTTEVYPDSPMATGEDCINAQVAAITGGLNYILENA